MVSQWVLFCVTVSSLASWEKEHGARVASTLMAAAADGVEQKPPSAIGEDTIDRSLYGLWHKSCSRKEKAVEGGR